MFVQLLTIYISACLSRGSHLLQTKSGHRISKTKHSVSHNNSGLKQMWRWTPFRHFIYSNFIKALSKNVRFISHLKFTTESIFKSNPWCCQVFIKQLQLNVTRWGYKPSDSFLYYWCEDWLTWWSIYCAHHRPPPDSVYPPGNHQFVR